MSYSRADNQLFGQGAAPVQSLAINREEVFTGPQSNSNSLDFVTLNASLDMTRTLALQGAVYFRNLRQSLVNGNSTGYTSCTSPGDAGLLCQPGGTTPLVNSAGEPLPDISNGGAQYIGENDFEWIHSQNLGGSVQITGTQPLFAHNNQFALGASVDSARIDFSTATEVGPINASLTVLPSGLFVSTPENTGYSATPVSLRATNDYYGFYATDTWDASPALAITASGRYNIAQIDLSDQLGSDLNGINRFTHFNPALGATYKLSPNRHHLCGLFDQQSRAHRERDRMLQPAPAVPAALEPGRRPAEPETGGLADDRTRVARAARARRFRTPQLERGPVSHDPRQ